MSTNHPSKAPRLQLTALEHFPDTQEIRYEFATAMEKFEFSAPLSEAGNIRGIGIPTEMEIFLRPFWALHPDILKIIIQKTWMIVDGEQFTPVKLA